MEPEFATVADIPEIVAIWRECFDDPIFDGVWPPNEAGDAYLTEAIERFIDPEKPGRVTVIRVNMAIKSIIIYFVESGGIRPLMETWPPRREGQDPEKFDDLFDTLEKMHRAGAAGTQDHIYIETVMTALSARRQGMATKLLAYVADAAGPLPSFLNSSKEGFKLYERVGFKPIELDSDVKPMEGTTPMLKPGRG